MYGLSLDLRDRDRVEDFIQEQLSYLESGDKRKMEKQLAQIEKDPHLPTEHLAKLALQAGALSWPARRSLAAFLRTQQGCDEEWRMTVAAVSQSTGHLMQRFHHATQCVSLDDVLEHEEGSAALRDTERMEISEVRHHIRVALWQRHHESLTHEQQQEQDRLQQITQRLDVLREIADTSASLQDELLDKIGAWDDELFFVGKALNTEELDEEIRYYREAAATPVEERA